MAPVLGVHSASRAVKGRGPVGVPVMAKTNAGKGHPVTWGIAESAERDCGVESGDKTSRWFYFGTTERNPYSFRCRDRQEALVPRPENGRRAGREVRGNDGRVA